MGWDGMGYCGSAADAPPGLTEGLFRPTSPGGLHLLVWRRWGWTMIGEHMLEEDVVLMLPPPPYTFQPLALLYYLSTPLLPNSSYRSPPSLTRELEKKLSDKYIVFLSQRRVLPKPKRNSSAAHKQKRPRSRTLTAVHEKILEELVWPSEITGKRTRVAQDGGKLIRV